MIRPCHGSKTDWVWLYLLVETLELMMTALSETPPPAGNIHAETGGRYREIIRERRRKRKENISINRIHD